MLEEVCFPGAAYLELQFDPETSTEVGEDFITIYKDRGQTEVWGRKNMSGKPTADDRPGAIPSKVRKPERASFALLNFDARTTLLHTAAYDYIRPLLHFLYFRFKFN